MLLRLGFLWLADHRRCVDVDAAQRFCWRLGSDRGGSYLLLHQVSWPTAVLCVSAFCLLLPVNFWKRWFMTGWCGQNAVGDDTG